MILKIYRLRAPQENISLFLIPGDTSSGKAFRRSFMNPRRQDSVINSYAGGILSKGVMLLFRGCIIAVQSDTEGVYDLIAGASLVEAIYLAIEMKPGNQYVKGLVETGIRIQVLLRFDSPRDGQCWVENEHSSFRFGSARSFVEVYEETLAVKAGWDAYKEEKRITVATCPRAGEFRFEKLYEKFSFANYPNLHKSWFPMIARSLQST